MKLYFCINDYLMYIAAISELLNKCLSVEELRIPEFDMFRCEFTRLAAVIPALKSDLNDSFRDEGPGIHGNKKHLLSEFEAKCAEVQARLRKFVADGYACETAQELLMLFLKKFALSSGRSFDSVLTEKIKPLCGSVFVEMSKTFGMDMSPRAFRYGGYLDLKEVSFKYCFKSMIAMSDDGIRGLFDSTDVANALLDTMVRNDWSPPEHQERIDVGDLLENVETD
nr:P21 [Carrot closterovirus 3]